jgi:hypothetical protein
MNNHIHWKSLRVTALNQRKMVSLHKMVSLEGQISGTIALRRLWSFLIISSSLPWGLWNWTYSKVSPESWVFTINLQCQHACPIPPFQQAGEPSKTPPYSLIYHMCTILPLPTPFYLFAILHYSIFHIASKVIFQSINYTLSVPSSHYLISLSTHPGQDLEG